MDQLTLREAQLFRMLASFFGEQHVVPLMRVIALCDGEIPEGLDDLGVDLAEWAGRNRCLFTVVNQSGDPCLVVEFFSGFKEGVVDQEEVEHQRYLRPILAARGVRYLTISDQEFSEILDPAGGLDFFVFLKEKVELAAE